MQTSLQRTSRCLDTLFTWSGQGVWRVGVRSTTTLCRFSGIACRAPQPAPIRMEGPIVKTDTAIKRCTLTCKHAVARQGRCCWSDRGDAHEGDEGIGDPQNEIGAID